MNLTRPAIRRAVARLEKALGLRHDPHPTRGVSVYVGLARIADRAERDVARALQAAWTDALDGLDMADLYQRGQVDAVVGRVAERVRLRTEIAAQRAFLGARQRAGEFLSGTDVPADVAKQFPQMDFFHRLLASLDWFLLNPRMVTAARTQATALSAVEHGNTVEAIRQAVVTGLEQGLPYDEAADLIESSVGLNRRQQTALSNLADRLTRNGITGEDRAAALDAYAERARAYRAEMIARTEGQHASNGGAYDTYQASQNQGLLEDNLVKEWIASNDACPICAPANGQQRRLNEPFVLDVPRGGGTIVVDHPPAHPNCRCKFGMAERKPSVRPV